MQRNEFFNLISGLFQYFRYKDSPKSETIDEWLTDLKYIDSDAISFIKQAIKENDNLPRNLPKAIKAIYAIYKRQKPTGNFVRYDPYEDLRFPVSKMHQATEIYINKGRAAFIEYCENERMPEQDRERCENKVNCLFDKGKVKELVNDIGEDFSEIIPTDKIDKIKETEKRKQESFDFETGGG